MFVLPILSSCPRKNPIGCYGAACLFLTWPQALVLVAEDVLVLGGRAACGRGAISPLTSPTVFARIQNGQSPLFGFQPGYVPFWAFRAGTLGRARPPSGRRVEPECVSGLSHLTPTPAASSPFDGGSSAVSPSSSPSALLELGDVGSPRSIRGLRLSQPGFGAEAPAFCARARLLGGPASPCRTYSVSFCRGSESRSRGTASSALHRSTRPSPCRPAASSGSPYPPRPIWAGPRRSTPGPSVPGCG